MSLKDAFRTDYERGPNAVSPLGEAAIALACLGFLTALGIVAVVLVNLANRYDVAGWVNTVLAVGMPLLIVLFVLGVIIAWCVRMYRWTRDWWRGCLPRED